MIGSVILNNIHGRVYYNNNTASGDDEMVLKKLTGGSWVVR